MFAECHCPQCGHSVGYILEYKDVSVDCPACGNKVQPSNAKISSGPKVNKSPTPEANHKYGCQRCGFNGYFPKGNHTCQQCGRPMFRATIDENTPWKVWLQLFMALIAAPVICLYSCHQVYKSDHPNGAVEKQKLTLSQKERTMLSDLERNDLLRVERNQQKVYVDIMLWVGMDAQRKETFTRMMAIECADSDYYTVEIYDKQSARKLADFGPFRGFNVY